MYWLQKDANILNFWLINAMKSGASKNMPLIANLQELKIGCFYKH
jgi:hypothetical protein